MSVEYQAGQCNIGPGEQRKRLRFGALGFLATAVWVGIVAAFGLPAWTLIAAVGPLFGAVMGVLQARERFCVGFALQGVFDTGSGRDAVEDEAARRADRQRAYRLVARSGAYALAGALALFLVARLVSRLG